MAFARLRRPAEGEQEGAGYLSVRHRAGLAAEPFGQESGLLLRVVRYGRSPIGRVPTQVDYGDYRDVKGIKMPFKMVFAWMDGRDAIQLSDIQTNMPIDAAKFQPPAEPAAAHH